MTSVVLAGGGTAGHTSPMIATAKALAALEPGVDLVCIGTAKGLETRVVPEAGLRLELITPVPLSRRLDLDLLKLPWTLTKAVRQARRVLKQAHADALVGFGGYVSIPAYLAARTMGVPVVVHEANKLPGIANRVGARFARFVGTTFPETQLPGGRCIGMPMAASVTRPSTTREAARESFGLDVERPTLLVSGGSQGAVALNAALMGATGQILEAGVQILHVLGPKNFTEADRVIESASGARYHPVAFVSEMATAYAAADLMVARAGAATVMETAVAGLPVIFVPLPWGNGEQAKNAAGLVAAGAGVMLPEAELTAERLAAEVLPRISDPTRLRAMSELARAEYPSDAAEVLARAVLDIAEQAEQKDNQ